MRLIQRLTTGVVVLALSAVPAAANLLVNPGFEAPITYDGAPFIGSWEGFSAGGTASAANSSVMPRSGAMHLDVTINGDDNSFAGVFQDVTGFTGGNVVTAEIYAKVVGQFPDAGFEYRLEFRDSVSNTEVSRVMISPSLTSEYAAYGITETVPFGADTIRFTLALQTFGGGSNTASLYIDDTSLVPEPASMVGLAMVGGLALVRRRR